MRVARATGWPVSSVSLALRYGRRFEIPMRRLEDMQPPKNLNPERRANCARRSSRFLLPRPPLRDFTTEMQAEGADSRRPVWLPAKNAGRKVRGLAPLRPPRAGARKTKTLWGHQRVRCRFLMEPAPSHLPWFPCQARPPRSRLQPIIPAY